MRLRRGCLAAVICVVCLVLFVIGMYMWATRPVRVLSVDYPAGGSLEVFWVRDRMPPFYGFEGGDLAYRVSANGRVARGRLHPHPYDVLADVDLSFEILDDRTVRVTCSGPGRGVYSWEVDRDGAVVDLGEANR